MPPLLGDPGTLRQSPANRFKQGLDQYRSAIERKLPIHAGLRNNYIDRSVPAIMAFTPQGYRREARALWEAGSDGIYLFNFFTSRHDTSQIAQQPPFFLLTELHDRHTIGQVSQPIEATWHRENNVPHGQKGYFIRRA